MYSAGYVTIHAWSGCYCVSDKWFLQVHSDSTKNADDRGSLQRVVKEALELGLQKPKQVVVCIRSQFGLEQFCLGHTACTSTVLGHALLRGVTGGSHHSSSADTSLWWGSCLREVLYYGSNSSTTMNDIQQEKDLNRLIRILHLPPLYG
jgi:hypothetical protein